MNATMIPIITIDGPTSSGKGTIGKLLAEKLHWHFLDSGILYRILALAALQKQIAPDDSSSLTSLASAFMDTVEITDANGKAQQVFYNGTNVTDAIRQEACSSFASRIAALPEVRAALLPCYHKFLRLPGLVADGRDMGTVVFPQAVLKIFLTASVEVRAQRRWRQLQTKGINVRLDEIARDLSLRDQRDSERKIAPLKPATNAEIVDTTALEIGEVLNILLTKAKELGVV